VRSIQTAPIISVEHHVTAAGDLDSSVTLALSNTIFACLLQLHTTPAKQGKERNARPRVSHGRGQSRVIQCLPIPGYRPAGEPSKLSLHPQSATTAHKWFCNPKRLPTAC
jgi:hypothetical protein